MRHGAPIRFLILLFCGWTGLRLVAWAPHWLQPDVTLELARGGPPAAEASFAPAALMSLPPPRPGEGAGVDPASAPRPALRPEIRHPAGTARDRLALMAWIGTPARPPATPPPPDMVPIPVPPPTGPAIAPGTSASGSVRRWSGSAWLLLRRDGGASLAPGGVLGGSQAGARVAYRINDDIRSPLALSVRAYVPLRRPSGAEAAVGLDWQPSASIPVRLLVERRQRLGRDGRSAFAITAYGGGAVGLGGGWRLEGYGQAGIVGARSRDVFVDGSARVLRSLGPVEVGGALWGAAQPNAARVDAGPQLALPFRAAGASLRLSAEYRFRIAGDARPASGPALTLGVDF